MRRNTTLLLAGLCTVAATTRAVAQDEWTRQVSRLLDAAAQTATSRGLSRTHQPFIGSLNERANEAHTLQLSAGTSYQIVGVCDNDCTDFDLRLYDPRGRMVAEDVLTDDTPVLSVTPGATGTYTLRAIMTTCSSEPCRYGIGVYGSRGGSASTGSGSVGDGDQWAGQVANLLNRASEMVTSRGMHRTHEPYIGSLRNGASEIKTVQLNAGTSYSMIGVCDNDCSDLDLRLYDPSGTEVDSDVLDDDTPIVEVTPRRTGTYTVRAIMTACSNEPCRYGIGIYGR